MRTIKELLEVLRDNENQKYFIGGLCGMTTRMEINNIITTDEDENLNAYIKINAPNRLSTSYNWDYGEWEPRLKWINEQIELLTNQ